MSCIELQKILEASDKENCFSIASSARESGKRFAFDNRNNKTICRVKIDDCLITSKQIKKCDFLFRVFENNKYYLVELKGIAVMDAVVQIINTFEIVNIKIKANPENYKGIIVSSAVPSATEQRFRRIQDKYYKENRIRISKTHMWHKEII